MSKNRKFISPQMKVIDYYNLIINECDIFKLKNLLKKWTEIEEVYKTLNFNKHNVQTKNEPVHFENYINNHDKTKYEYERVETFQEHISIKDYIKKSSNQSF